MCKKNKERVLGSGEDPEYWVTYPPWAMPFWTPDSQCIIIFMTAEGLMATPEKYFGSAIHGLLSTRVFILASSKWYRASGDNSCCCCWAWLPAATSDILSQINLLKEVNEDVELWRITLCPRIKYVMILLELETLRVELGWARRGRRRIFRFPRPHRRRPDLYWTHSTNLLLPHTQNTDLNFFFFASLFSLVCTFTCLLLLLARELRYCHYC